MCLISYCDSFSAFDIVLHWLTQWLTVLQLHDRANFHYRTHGEPISCLVIKLSNPLPAFGPPSSGPGFLVPHFQILHFQSTPRFNKLGSCSSAKKNRKWLVVTAHHVRVGDDVTGCDVRSHGDGSWERWREITEASAADWGWRQCKPWWRHR